MKRKLTALFLALCLTMSLTLPVLAAAETRYFYNQLDPQAKEVYDHFLEDRNVLRSGELRFTLQNTSYSEIEACMKSSLKALEALTEDHPDLFWFSNTWNCSWEGSYASGAIQVKTGIGANWLSGARSVSADDAYVTAQVSAVAQSARSAGKTWYDWLGYAHDYLTRANRYNIAAFHGGINYADRTPWTPLSALSADLSPVCEGYSSAFKLICDELGIPCILASGGNHQWNYVRMEDGNWYGMDVTYDDPISSYSDYAQPIVSGMEGRKYFLVGSNNFRDHTPSPASGDSTVWKYPVLSAVDYDPAKAVSADQLHEEPPAPAEAPDSWAAEEVSSAISANLAPAALQSRYRTNITRLEFARLAVSLVEQTTGMTAAAYAASKGLTAGNSFSDTSDPAALTACALGIVNGRGAGKFVPDGPITRQEAAKMLTSTAKALGRNTSARGASFADADQFSDWARDAIAYVSAAADPATGNKVMGGVGENRFNPTGTYTRQQAIVTIYRLYRAISPR